MRIGGGGRGEERKREGVPGRRALSFDAEGNGTHRTGGHAGTANLFAAFLFRPSPCPSRAHHNIIHIFYMVLKNTLGLVIHEEGGCPTIWPKLRKSKGVMRYLVPAVLSVILALT